MHTYSVRIGNRTVRVAARNPNQAVFAARALVSAKGRA